MGSGCFLAPFFRRLSWWKHWRHAFTVGRVQFMRMGYTIGPRQYRSLIMSVMVRVG